MSEQSRQQRWAGRPDPSAHTDTAASQYEPIAGQQWDTHAGLDPDFGGQPRFVYPGDEFYVRLYGYEPLEVTLTENPEGDYWGWIDFREWGEVQFSPEMVYPHEVLFNACWPSGYEAEVRANRGRVVRLDITERKP